MPGHLGLGPMAYFVIIYRIKGYSPADASNPDPYWGKIIYTANGASAGTEDIEVVRRLASSAEWTPEGYELLSVKDNDAAGHDREPAAPTSTLGRSKSMSQDQ